MIKRFRHKGLKRLFERGDVSGVDPQQAPKLRRMLTLLDAGDGPTALNLPGYKVHPLTGNRKGQWAAWVTGNCRLTFKFEAGHATNLDLEDYH
jgi:proteic killer suppression protein